ncbi:MAG: replication initiation protein [Porticoccaceae bacterium]|nr:replication initiation protein [Porticoccaceae bacterium]
MGTTTLAKQQKMQHYDMAADRPDSSRYVYMSNAVARAAQGLSLAEKRIIMTAASRLDSRRVPPPGGAPVTRISAMDYAETFGIDLNTAYEQLQDAGKELYKRSITFTEPKIGKRKGGAVHTLRWIGRATYHKGEGWIELAWWHEVMPHLCGLQRQFTKYQLQQASALRSLYSWRLLELMQSWQDKGRFEISIEDFAKAMEATEKQRQDFAAIRRRMIEPAIKELEQKDGWLIQWEPVKLGRKVSSLRFAFMKNPQQSLL